MAPSAGVKLSAGRVISGLGPQLTFRHMHQSNQRIPRSRGGATHNATWYHKNCENHKTTVRIMLVLALSFVHWTVEKKTPTLIIGVP